MFAVLRYTTRGARRYSVSVYMARSQLFFKAQIIIMSTMRTAEKMEKKLGMDRGRKLVASMSSGIPNSIILKEIMMK